MCHAITCGACGKVTWGGCGRHVAMVHRQIRQGQHCTCRPWPGVQIEEGSTVEQSSASHHPFDSRCTIM